MSKGSPNGGALSYICVKKLKGETRPSRPSKTPYGKSKQAGKAPSVTPVATRGARPRSSSIGIYHPPQQDDAMVFLNYYGFPFDFDREMPEPELKARMDEVIRRKEEEHEKQNADILFSFTCLIKTIPHVLILMS